MSITEIQKIIEELLQHSDFSFESISCNSAEDGMVWFTVVSNDSKLIIGKNGETLEALNHIARKIVEQKEGHGVAHTSFVVDVNNYQKKKTESIKTIAHMMAERARFFKASVEIEPMNAFERKIVHTFLESAKNIKTESVGQGPSRHVVVRYIEE